MNEGSDIYDLEPWAPSASTPWSFLFSSFTPEPCYWDVILPWEDNPYDLGIIKLETSTPINSL